MATYYVKNTGTGVGGTTWATAFTTLKAAMEAAAAGDTIYVSQAHTETSAVAVSIASTGTPNAPLKVICGNDSQQPPTTLAATASVATTGASDFSIDGSCYVYGITFSVGSGTSLASFRAGNSTPTNNSVHTQTYDNCKIRLSTSAASARIVPRYAGKITFKNTTVRFGSGSQRIDCENTPLFWDGGGIESGGAAPTTGLFECGVDVRPSVVTCSGLDLTNLGNNPLVYTLNSGSVVLRNCKMPSGWSGTLYTGTKLSGHRADLHNYGGGDFNYKIWTEDYYGTLVDETTVVRSGGASDGVTPLSWKITTSANTSYPSGTFETPEIVAWNNLVAQRTVTVEILHDSLTALKNDEIWLEVQYLGADGFPISSFAHDAPATVLTASANQSSSVMSWTTTGLSNPNRQALSVTVQPYEKGFLIAKVKVAKPSTTVYVDPKLVIS